MGVSNTAGTLDFINNMDNHIEKEKAIIVSITIIVIGIIIAGFITLFISINNDTCSTSSPVEEMYHKQLVVTLDSILDARLDAGCCEEVIDSDDISVTHNRFGRVLAPIE